MTNDATECKNTDREIWREVEDYFASRIFVTESGEIGIDVNGAVIVMPVRAWHTVAMLTDDRKRAVCRRTERRLHNEVRSLRGVIRSALEHMRAGDDYKVFEVLSNGIRKSTE